MLERLQPCIIGDQVDLLRVSFVPFCVLPCREKKSANARTYTDGLSYQTRLPVTQAETPARVSERKTKPENPHEAKMRMCSAGVEPSLWTARALWLGRASSVLAVPAIVPRYKISSFSLPSSGFAPFPLPPRGTSNASCIGGNIYYPPPRTVVKS